MNWSQFVRHIELYIPNSLLSIYRWCKRKYLWILQRIAYKVAIYKVRKKNGPLNVLFIVFEQSLWKYDSLFQLMLKDECFNPTIFVCPNEAIEKELMIARFEETYSYFSCIKKYPTYSAYDDNMNLMNIDDLLPDIIFYPTPYLHNFPVQYNQYSLRKYLKCYVNYAFVNVPYSWSIASAFQGLMWLYLIECESNQQLALSYSRCEFQNTRIVGYPIYDEYQKNKGEIYMWKDADSKFKRIIWAPHHSIEGHNGLLSLSTFLETAEEMLELAENLKDKFQFAFKPHPFLLEALYKHPKWGKEKTNLYYRKWKEGENTTLVDGVYMDLFKSSDALIHDCGSFIVEYLYSNKPVMYLGNSREEQSNIVGKRAYRCHYHGTTIEDVKQFINKVVLNNIDSMKQEREQFYNEVLLPPNGVSVAENIIYEIKNELCRSCLKRG